MNLNLSYIELPSAKAGGFFLHQELLILRQSYTLSKSLTFRSPYGRMMKYY